MKTTRGLFAAAAVLVVCGAAFAGSADQALEKLQVKRGICAVAGEGACELAIEMAGKRIGEIIDELGKDSDCSLLAAESEGEMGRKTLDDLATEGEKLLVISDKKPEGA